MAPDSFKSRKPLFVAWFSNKGKGQVEIGVRRARVLMHYFTGVAARCFRSIAGSSIRVMKRGRSGWMRWKIRSSCTAALRS